MQLIVKKMAHFLILVHKSGITICFIIFYFKKITSKSDDVVLIKAQSVGAEIVMAHMEFLHMIQIAVFLVQAGLMKVVATIGEIRYLKIFIVN